MRVVDYKQTVNKDDAVAFINSVDNACVYEITVHGRELDFSKLRACHVYIDNELFYVLKPDEGSYWCRRLGEFYLSKGEAWQLCKYFENYAEGGVTPSWWAQADRNIRRHSDPLMELREALVQGFDVTVEFME